MKKVFIIALAFIPLLCKAQEKDIYDTAADKICVYMNAHKEVKINSSKDAESFFAKAFLETCMPLVDRLLAKEGLTSFDGQSGELLGKKVGIKLAVTCPKYLEMVSNVIKKGDDSESETLQGTVVQVWQDGYTYLKIKTSDGTQKRVVWLETFEDAENFNNDPQKLLNKKVQLTWKSRQLYYFKSKSFAAEKIITGVKIN